MVRESIKQKIDQRYVEIENAKEKAVEEEARKYGKVIAECNALKTRMQDLIDTANYVRKKGIEFPNSETMKEYGYQYEPYADGLDHGVGFARPRNVTDEIDSMAIIGGGHCGEWDLYASPKSGFYMKHKRLGTRMPAGCHLLKKFARDFPLFEAAFYDWIESGMK